MMPLIRNIRNSHISPVVISLILAVTFQNFLQVVSAQEYLSTCNSTKLCSAEKFLTCQAGKCQCEDSLNQLYDAHRKSCVILAGRNCRSNEFESDDLFDPRKLIPIPESSAPVDLAFPTCGNNAFCDVSTSTCHCKKSYFHNESSGVCELSFGSRCSFSDSIVFNSTDPKSKGNNTGKANVTTPMLKTTYVACDSSLGLHCASDGICTCHDTAIWQINRGCVPLDGSGNSNEMDTGNLMNNFNSFPNSNFGEDQYRDELTPFQRLVNEYTKALLEANNFESFNPQTDTGMASMNNSSAMGIHQNSSNILGDRNQFPGIININGQTQNNNPNWNLLWPQNLSDTSINNDILQLQEQAIQLQRLLDQQQQLQQLIDQLTSSSASQQQPQQQQQSSLFGVATTTASSFPATPAPLSIPQNNYLGSSGHPQSILNNNNRNYIYPQAHQNYWQSPLYQHHQQHPFSLLGGPFSLFRLFRNFIDPIKRKLFPNFADLAHNLPSPLYIAAATVNNFLPILRAVDHQITPMLHNIIELTKPRPRPTTPPPLIYNNHYPQPQQQHQQPWNGGNRNYVINNPQLNLPTLHLQNGNRNYHRQQPFHSILGNSIRNSFGRMLQQPRNIFGGVSPRTGRTRNGPGTSRVNSNSNQKMWW